MVKSKAPLKLTKKDLEIFSKEFVNLFSQAYHVPKTLLDGSELETQEKLVKEHVNEYLCKRNITDQEVCYCTLMENWMLIYRIKELLLNYGTRKEPSEDKAYEFAINAVRFYTCENLS